MQVSKSQKGFTLIEILVVITIVGLIILTALYTLGRSSQQVRLQMGVEQVASNLRFDQTQVKSGHLAASGTVCRGYTFTSGSGGSSYDPVSTQYIAGECHIAGISSSPSLFYSTGVELSQIDSDNGVEPELTILFEPPHGEVLFVDASDNELNVSSVDLTFIYTLADYPFDRELSVNRAGQITYDITE